MPPAKYVVALEQFPTERDGQTVVVPRGARFPVSDPIVCANPAYFEPDHRKPATKRTRKARTEE